MSKRSRQPSHSCHPPHSTHRVPRHADRVTKYYTTPILTAMWNRRSPWSPHQSALRSGLRCLQPLVHRIRPEHPFLMMILDHRSHTSDKSEPRCDIRNIFIGPLHLLDPPSRKKRSSYPRSLSICSKSAASSQPSLLWHPSAITLLHS